MQGLEETINENFFSKVKNKTIDWFVERPKIASVLGGAATFGLFQGTPLLFGVNLMDPLILTATTVASVCAGYMTYYPLNAIKTIKDFGIDYDKIRHHKLLNKHKRRNRIREHKGQKNIFDYLFENPNTSAIITSLLGQGALIYNKAAEVGMEPIVKKWAEEPHPYLTGTALTMFSLYFFTRMGLRSSSALFHSSNWSQTKDMVKIKLHKFLGNEEKTIEMYTQAIKKHSLDEFLFELANLYSKKEMYTETFEVLKNAYEKKGLEDTVVSGSMKFEYLSELAKHISNMQKHPISLSPFLGTSLYCLKLGEKHKALEAWQQFLENTENDQELHLNAGLSYCIFLKHIGEEERLNKELQWVSKEIKNNFEADIESFGETTHKTYSVDINKFVRNTIIFKEGKIDEIEGETELTKIVQELIKDDERYSTYEVFGYSDEDDILTTVLKKAQGQILMNILEEDYSTGESYLEAVVDFLALLHAKVNPEDVGKRIRIPTKVKNKLRDPNLIPNNGLAKKVIENYRPVYNTFKTANYVFNKDAHPENWLISEKGVIICLDNEKKGLVPQQFDLVNLLEYTDTINDSKKEELIEKYVDSYNKHVGEDSIKDKKHFKLVYHNAIIQRAISLCSAWSSPHRKSMWKKRILVTNNALNAIKRIKEEHKDYFLRYENEYTNLKEALNEIKLEVSMAD